ncbi:Beta-hexosaminidase [Anaerohalosphaera lusitana]|uniref:beta-N-acetylhexosaminidase n=1 Tax=Anaerohalosphaera lusitana TaxID=1936003 RepID=A0A1U9NHN9_9BACT|nr:family 20 glycosylhydrolase [Anaerohalosphaera lusitana]AQT67026.1 Beta-hexosaminidase [Anaerohalosphaera lusitana]
MLRRSIILTAVLAFVLTAGMIQADEVSIIPKPVEMTVGGGEFELTENTKILVEDATQQVGDYLAETFEPATGFDLTVKKPGWFESKKNIIELTISDEISVGDEGYHLDVTPEKITVQGSDPAGVFYGCQTILQLLPAQVYSRTEVKGTEWTVPEILVLDEPRFEWRGMHLDVCRHFMPLDFVKQYIDYIAMHKMNTFHWHLTEDQGWRIEIEQYPKLTEISAWRKGPNGGKYGGYYTQDQIREVVEYAKQRFVTVVPEIEMPGHSVAALAAYPELSCTGGPFEVRTEWGVSRDVYCAGNEKTFEFLQNVLDEVIELFPSEYVHIGGDECPKVRWQNCPKCQKRIAEENLEDEHELQSYFIKRMEKYLAGKGKRLIGWDEILEGGLAPNATVMSWRGMGGGIAAAKSGHDCVMAPVSPTYFDARNSDSEYEPAAIGYTPNTLGKVYAYDPVPQQLTDEQAEHILGSQAQVWTEYIETPEHVEYMVLPRMSALAEVVWSPKKSKDWPGYQQRLAKQYLRYGAMNANYWAPIPKGLQEKNAFMQNGQLRLEEPVEGAVIRYTTNGKVPKADAQVYTEPVEITEDCTVIARTFMPDGKASVPVVGEYKKVTPHESVSVKNPKRGVKFSYYEGNFDKLPDFEKLEPAKKGVQPGLTLPDDVRENSFAVKLQGFLKVRFFGEYTFYTTSDDGSKLYIGDQLVVDNGGLHGSQEKAGTVFLKPGYHPITVTYFEAGGAHSLDVKWQGPVIKKRNIPANVLFHK